VTPVELRRERERKKPDDQPSHESLEFIESKHEKQSMLENMLDISISERYVGKYTHA
jgi:hypothetical protein